MLYTIDDYVRYDHSGLWGLHDAYYEHEGIAAWQTIPSLATNNYASALQHAQFLIAMAQESQGDFVVLEVGAGSGRFANNLLKALKLDCGSEGQALLQRLRYIFSDYAPRVVHEATIQPELQHHVTEGRVIPALMDLNQPGSLRRLDDTPLTLAPHIMLANYVTCVCRTRHFRLVRELDADDAWSELYMNLQVDVEPWLCRTLSRERALQLCADHLSNAEFFTCLHTSTQWNPIPLQTAFPDPRHAQILNEALFGLNRASISYPKTFIEMLLNLQDHLHGHTCPVLVTDFGNIDRRQQQGFGPFNRRYYGNTLNHAVHFVVFDGFAQATNRPVLRTRDHLSPTHNALISSDTTLSKNLQTAFNALYIERSPGQDRVDFDSAASALAEVGDWPARARFYKRCLQLDPHEPQLYLKFGEACVDASEPTLAKDVLQQGMEFDADDLKAHFTRQLGRAYALNQEPTQALQSYNDSLSITPHPQTWLHIAELHLAHARFEQAWLAASRALHCEPKNEKAAKMQDEIKERWWNATTERLQPELKKPF